MTSKFRLAQYGGYIFLVRTAMTPTQVEIVKNSFKIIATDAQKASQIFYDELFYLAPYLRQLFPEDMTRHKSKFVQMLATIIKGLEQVSAISEEVVNLGRRHMSYDVQPEHYAIVGEALVAMLGRFLGPRLTPEIQDAWVAAYDMLARLMQEEGATPVTAEGYYNVIIRSVLTAQYGVGIAAEKDGVGTATQKESPEKLRLIRNVTNIRSDVK